MVASRSPPPGAELSVKDHDGFVPLRKEWDGSGPIRITTSHPPDRGNFVRFVLRYLNRYKEFTDWRDHAVKELNYTPPELMAIVAKMIEEIRLGAKFPVLEKKDPPPADPDVVVAGKKDEPIPPVPPELRGKKTVDHKIVVPWVYDYLDDDTVTPADAPSAGAWSMLQWARYSQATRGEFYKNFAKPLMLPKEDKDEAEKEKAESAAAKLIREDHERLSVLGSKHLKWLEEQNGSNSDDEGE